MSDAPEWKSTPETLARARAALAEVDKKFVGLPVCSLPNCEQRVWRLDEFGLCSKVSAPHREWRDRARARVKAGAL
jgi:hypothetical protein